MAILGTDLAQHLGTELGSNLGNGGASVEPPIQLTGLKAWWDSRTTAQMNASPENGISSWTSRAGSMGPVALVQATQASRPVYRASVPQLGGQPGLQFDGIDDQLRAVVPADWIFLHAGTGMTAFVYMRLDGSRTADQRMLSTALANPTDVGIQWSFASATVVALRFANGSGTYLNNLNLTAAGHIERDVPVWRAFTQGSGGRVAYAGGGATTLTAANIGGQVGSTSAPVHALQLGGYGATDAVKGWVAQILLYDRVLTPAEIASLGAFFDSIYRDVPQQIPGLKAWFDSRTAAQMTLIAANAVNTWTSRAGSMGPSITLSQATAANRPTYVSPVPALGNRPGVQFDGADDSISAAAAADWTFLHNGSGASVFMVHRIDSTGPSLQVLFATTGAIATTATGVYVNSTSGTSLLERVANGGGVAYTNNWSPADAALVSRDVAKWTLWGYSTGNQLSAAAGVSVSNADTGPAPSSSPPTSPLRIGGVAAAGTLKASIAQIIIYDRVLSAAEINQLANWVAMEYPGLSGAALETPETIPNLKAWFDSRSTTYMDLSGANVVNWRSRAGSMGPLLALSQATASLQPTYQASVPQLGGRPSVSFDGVDDLMQALTPADWISLHNGLGSTIFYVARLDQTGPANQAIVSTCGQANNVIGMNETLAATSFSTRISNGSGTAYQNVSAGTQAGHWERDALRWRALTHGAGVRRAYAGGGAATVVTNDNGGAVAATGDPSYALRLSSTSGAGIKGWVPQLLFYDRELSASEIASLGAFFEAQYAEVPQQIPGLKAWFDSRTAAQMDIVSGAVQNWRSRAGSMGTSLAFTQGTAANRPQYVSSIATLGNRPGLQFDGVDDWLDVSDTTLGTALHSGTGSSVFRVFRMDSTGGATQRLGNTCAVTTQIGCILQFATNLVVQITNGTATNVNVFTTAPAPHFARDVSRWQLHGYVVGAAHSRVSGSSVSNPDSGGPPSTAPATFPLRIGASNAATFPFKGWLCQELYYDHVLTDAETASLAAWAASEYGVTP